MSDLHFVWDATGLLNKVTSDTAGRMTKAGIYFVGRLRQAVNTGQEYKRYKGKHGIYYHGLNPSKPGEMPHKLTGQLQRSITWKLDKANLVLTVGSGLDYAGYLQTGTKKMKSRPWLSRTWSNEKAKVTSIILGGK